MSRNLYKRAVINSPVNNLSISGVALPVDLHNLKAIYSQLAISRPDSTMRVSANNYFERLLDLSLPGRSARAKSLFRTR